MKRAEPRRRPWPVAQGRRGDPVPAWTTKAFREAEDTIKMPLEHARDLLHGVSEASDNERRGRWTERLNSKTISIKRKAGGLRNAQKFATAIHFHCGGLDLHPR